MDWEGRCDDGARTYAMLFSVKLLAVVATVNPSYVSQVLFEESCEVVCAAGKAREGLPSVCVVWGCRDCEVAKKGTVVGRLASANKNNSSCPVSFCVLKPGQLTLVVRKFQSAPQLER